MKKYQSFFVSEKFRFSGGEIFYIKQACFRNGVSRGQHFFFTDINFSLYFIGLICFRFFFSLFFLLFYFYFFLFFLFLFFFSIYNTYQIEFSLFFSILAILKLYLISHTWLPRPKCNNLLLFFYFIVFIYWFVFFSSYFNTFSSLFSSSLPPPTPPPLTPMKI